MSTSLERSSSAPPILLIGIQLVATISDVLMQRAYRIEYKNSTRRSLFVGTAIAASVSFVLIPIFSAFVPESFASKCFGDDGRLVDCCSWSSSGDRVCKLYGSQGLRTMFRSVFEHPFLLLNGVSAVVYCSSSVILLKHSAGQILKVNATLASTFVITPLIRLLMPYENVRPIAPIFVCISILGATLSTISPSQVPFCRTFDDGVVDLSRSNRSKADEKRYLLETEAAGFDRPSGLVVPRTRSLSDVFVGNSSAKASAEVLGAFVLMVASSATWTVMQRYAQSSCGINYLGRSEAPVDRPSRFRPFDDTHDAFAQVSLPSIRYSRPHTYFLTSPS